MTKECSLLLPIAWGLLGVIGLLDVEFATPLWPYDLLLLLGPFSAHITSACFIVAEYLQLQHPTFPALSMYLCVLHAKLIVFWMSRNYIKGTANKGLNAVSERVNYLNWLIATKQNSILLEILTSNINKYWLDIIPLAEFQSKAFYTLSSFYHFSHSYFHTSATINSAAYLHTGLSILQYIIAKNIIKTCNYNKI